jgi:hypothetical protein
MGRGPRLVPDLTVVDQMRLSNEGPVFNIAAACAALIRGLQSRASIRDLVEEG